MKSRDIRDKFQKYFSQLGHERVSSSSLVPHGDSSLLFVNAGMNPFKDYFMGIKKPPHSQLYSIQKCLRAGGKHNDLEQVGISPYHHTFFEMLGFFSFGSYFKKEAIHYSLEFLTKQLGLPKDRLWVSVFKEDETSVQIWQKHHNIPKERIFLLDEQSNFWRMGAAGPCGPCSEIYFHPNPDNTSPKVEDLMEVWNLVFMSFYENEQGQQKPLPTPCIDTGMGLERISQILQEKNSNYDTDLFSPIITSIQSQVKELDHEGLTESEKKQAFYVLADHARAIAFLIADNMSPSNEGRGYVLRRIIRRASYYEQKLQKGEERSLLPAGIQAVISQMKSFYPELETQQKYIQATVQKEQEFFFKNLKKGQSILNKEIQAIKKQKNKILSATTAFTLYDTHGFPFDLTQAITREQGLQVDEKGFHQCMEQNKKSNRQRSLQHKKQTVQMESYQKKFLEKQKSGTFTGYNKLTEDQAQLLDFVILPAGEEPPSSEGLQQGHTAWFVFNVSPFYPEGGGQVGDQGLVEGPQGLAQVQDCYHRQDILIHEVKILKGTFKKKDTCCLKVDGERRGKIAVHHTATHLLHSALRKILGPHVKQAGSLVHDQKLRFDFTFSRPLEIQEITQVESLVNQWVSEAWPVTATYLSKEEALSQGALAFFEDKYQDKVRMLKIGPHSLELCGGTHISNTAHILFFAIAGQTGVGAGIRRIEAIAGPMAQQQISDLVQNHRQLHHLFNLGPVFSSSQSSLLLQKIQNLQKEIKQLKKNPTPATPIVESLKIEKFIFCLDNNSYDFLFSSTELLPSQLGTVAEKLKNQLKGEGIIVLSGTVQDKKCPLVIACTKKLTDKVSAHTFIQKLCADLGGKGGGREHFARGVITSPITTLKTWLNNWCKNPK